MSEGSEWLPIEPAAPAGELLTQRPDAKTEGEAESKAGPVLRFLRRDWPGIKRPYAIVFSAFIR